MSLDQYNSLMSNLLKQKHALTSLRAKLEGKKNENVEVAKSSDT